MLCYYICGAGVGVSIVVLIGLIIAYFRTQNISAINKAKYIVHMLVILGIGYSIYMIYLIYSLELTDFELITSLTPIGIILAAFIIIAAMKVSLEAQMELEKQKGQGQLGQDPLETI